MRAAMFYETAGESKVICRLCPHDCKISPGRKGVCRVRENKEGELYTLNYGKISSWGMDPIEKKPLYHFYPSSLIFSAGTVGCNFHCQFCQNWEIAQGNPPLADITSEQLAEMAGQQGSIGMAYTYSEPLMWYEFVLECAKLLHQKGLKNVLVTNGFIKAEPLSELLPYLDAINLDIKGFTGDFYRKIVKGRYEPVLETAQAAYNSGCHLELTTLLIPGLNDATAELEELTDWIASELGPAVPLHFSRYFPNYQMRLSPTPVSSLKNAYEIACKKLHYVYLGNIQIPGKADTYCPNCREKVIERDGYSIKLSGLKDAACKFCGYRLEIVL